MTAVVELPFPPATLSGHNKGHWRSKLGLVAKHRDWAREATLAAGVAVEADGDIPLAIFFYPPDQRGDRVNYPNRIKAQLDGIAEALKVNDRRFLPSYHFCAPVKDARVTYVIGGAA